VAKLRAPLRPVAALVYSTTIGYLVFGLFWFTFYGWIPATVALVIGALLGIRIAALFASMTSIATLNWSAIWLGTIGGIVALAATWPDGIGASAEPTRQLLSPIVATSVIVVATAGGVAVPKSSHFYNSARFARFLHALQGLILFIFSLPASIFWAWTRPYVLTLTLSAFALWKLWNGACPVTLTENAARAREGLPLMPPESGFIPDVLARFGIVVSGNAVAFFLYGLGFSLCGWIWYTWLF
jgi:hypothetical protein